MFTAVTHLTVLVHDQEQTLNFYKKLGFIVHTDEQYGADMRWLTLCFPEKKNFELAIIQAKTDQDKALVGNQAGGMPFFTLETTDCFKDYEMLKAHGIEVGKPEQQPWGISMGLVDNSGNKIYVCQPN
jgi:hypothetical protein